MPSGIPQVAEIDFGFSRWGFDVRAVDKNFSAASSVVQLGRESEGCEREGTTSVVPQELERSLNFSP
jgi:hypothetical protein